MNRGRIVAAVGVVIAFACSQARGAAPDVKSLFPAGAAAGSTVEVVAAGTLKPWPPKVRVSGEGVRFEPLKDEGKFRVVVEAGTAPGVRWIRFYNDDGAAAPRGFIIGAVPEVAETETNDTGDDGVKRIERPTTINGRLAKAGDIDAFHVRLAAGRTFVAWLDCHTPLATPLDAVLQLATADGHVVAQNLDERGLDPGLTFTAPRDGDYLIRVFGYAAEPSTNLRFTGAADGVYRLTVGCGPVVDHAFPTVVEAGKPATTTLAGWNLAPESAVVHRTADGSAGDRSDVVLASTDGTSATNVAGRAAIVAVDVPTTVEHEPNDAAHPQSIAAPIAVNGRIADRGDRDVYALRAKKGDALRLRVASREFGFAVDPLLRVVKPDGTELNRFDDLARNEPDVDAVWRAPEDGEYRLIVEDLFGAAGLRHVYVLDVRPVGEDFSLTTAAGAVEGKAGKPFDVAVDVVRPSGMTAEIELSIEGLPEGTTGLTAISAAKGDTTKKVVLKPVVPHPFSGPLRIVGKIKGKAVARTATIAPSPGPGLPPIVDVWATVKK